MDSNSITFRSAARADLRRLVELLADDALGATRERPADPLPAAYGAAFEAIQSDPNQELLVAESDGGIAGFLQLTYIPSLTHSGAWRAQLEGVRVSQALRSSGVGTQLIEAAVARAARRGCRLVQLTTDKQRLAAVAFYERLGFEATHEGMKRWLPPVPSA